MSEEADQQHPELSELDIQLKLTNLEVEIFFTKWAERIDSQYLVEFGEDLMKVIRSIGDSIVHLMTPSEE